jgi:hypothetical protein
MFEILNAGQEPIIYNIISMGVTKIWGYKAAYF